MAKIGIIGGSGLDNPEILQDTKDIIVHTLYGQPSSPLKIGKISGIDVILLARHGREHTIPPAQVNFRANIHALKTAGCTHILATTACGSLREHIGRGDFVILDQFIDFTRHRAITFHDHFAPGKNVHTGMAEPFDQELRKILIKSCQELQFKHHVKGTVVTIEGPRFSTKAESYMFRSWGADVINMSIAPECILAKEAGLPYATIAMSTDYDCWKEDEAPVSWDEILHIFKANVQKVTAVLTASIPKIASLNCNIHSKPLQEIQGIEEIERKGEIKEIDLTKVIRTIPNWPKPGIMFRDITTLLENPEAFAYCLKKFKGHYHSKHLTKIAGIESRGFIFGAALARELQLPFILIRKKGKLPAETISQEYALEYGMDTVEVHKDALSPKDHVLIVDDLIATGGTAMAACRLVEKLGATVESCAFVIDLPDLKGKEKLAKYDVFTLVEFKGE